MLPAQLHATHLAFLRPTMVWMAPEEVQPRAERWKRGWVPRRVPILVGRMHHSCPSCLDSGNLCE